MLDFQTKPDRNSSREPRFDEKHGWLNHTYNKKLEIRIMRWFIVGWFVDMAQNDVYIYIPLRNETHTPKVIQNFVGPNRSLFIVLQM